MVFLRMNEVQYVCIAPFQKFLMQEDKMYNCQDEIEMEEKCIFRATGDGFNWIYLAKHLLKVTIYIM